MAILSKGQTFANTNSVTSTKLNALVDAAAFVAGASGTTDDSSLEVNVGGRLQVKDLGVTSTKIATGAVTTTKLPDSTIATDGVTYAKLQRVANMKVLGNVSGSLAVVTEVSILDEDNMVSDSATALTTQQSIKAYTDTKVAAVITRGTAVATTSGTSVDFTSIPSTVKRITVMLSGVSTNGTSPVILQLGDSGGVKITDYLGSATEARATPDSDLFTTGFGLIQSPTAGEVVYGIVTIVNLSGNIWVYSFAGGCSTTVQTYIGGGSKTLSATLDRIRLTTSGGVNTFDAGSVNIMYE
tara:strand:+ start:3330 stop:4223 length:894 start_codon:yes stop_codon:yes gene_type:complete